MRDSRLCARKNALGITNQYCRRLGWVGNREIILQEQFDMLGYTPLGLVQAILNRMSDARKLSRSGE